MANQKYIFNFQGQKCGLNTLLKKVAYSSGRVRDEYKSYYFTIPFLYPSRRMMFNRLLWRTRIDVTEIRSGENEWRNLYALTTEFPTFVTIAEAAIRVNIKNAEDVGDVGLLIVGSSTREGRYLNKVIMDIIQCDRPWVFIRDGEIDPIYQYKTRKEYVREMLKSSPNLIYYERQLLRDYGILYDSGKVFGMIYKFY